MTPNMHLDSTDARLNFLPSSHLMGFSYPHGAATRHFAAWLSVAAGVLNKTHKTGLSGGEVSPQAMSKRCIAPRVEWLPGMDSNHD